MTGTPESGRQAEATLEVTIDKAKQVAADIKEAADQLAVANTVLETRLPEAVQVGEVAQALGQADAVEKTLARSADSLDKVNAALDKVAAKPAGG